MAGLAQKGETRYLAVIGDVRRSREAKERAELQKRLEAGIQLVNRKQKNVLAAGFVITIGDEFQGLAGDPAAIMRVLVALETALPGVPLRYGLGWGALTTELRSRAVGMDGPCFHAAREAITTGKKLDRWVTVAGFGAEEDEILNGILSLIGAVRAGWTSTQAHTVALMRQLPTQKKAAAERGVAVSTVHKALSGALYGPVTEAERAVERLVTMFAKRPAPLPPAPAGARRR